MRLKSFNYIVGLLIIFYISPILSEEKIDIWKNKKETLNESQDKSKQEVPKDFKLNPSQKVQAVDSIQIQEGSVFQSDEQKVYGIYDPANYNFSLNMWSTTKADDFRSSLKRLSKINLSKSSSEILEFILFSFSYPPLDMSEKEFVKLKTDWLIQNNRINLIESFLKQNEQFESKSEVIQYLVDSNISSGNIKEGCEKISFIDANIKDAYLEKFKIYCLVFNDKKPEAQLLLDLLNSSSSKNKFSILFTFDSDNKYF